MSPAKDDWRKKEIALQEAVQSQIELIEKVKEDVLTITKPLFLRRGLDRVPEQIGSGIFVNVRGAVFLLTAAHVIENFNIEPIHIPLDGQYVELEGQDYRSRPGPEGNHLDDAIDVSVFKVEGVYEERLRELALPIEQTWILTDPLPAQFVFVGYPLRRAKRVGRQVFSYPQAWASEGRPAKDYERLGMAPIHTLLFEYSKRVSTGAGFIQSPSMKGLSGCGVWLTPSLSGVEKPHRLVGIFTGQKREGGVLVATNIFRHMQCIRRFHPELFPDWTDDASARKE